MSQQHYGVRPRSIGEIFSQTAAIYRDHFETIVGSAAAIVIPSTIIQILFFVVMLNNDDILAVFLLQILAGILMAAGVAAAMAVVTSATAQIIVEGKTSVVKAFDYSLPRIIDTLKATYLLYWIMSFLLWTFVGIPIAIFFAVAWLVTLQVVILEDSGARVALGRSWELTRNNRFRVLGALILLMAVSAILMSLFLLPMFALILRFAINGADGGTPPMIAWLLVGLFWVVGAVLIIPLQYLAWTLIYLDLRARNDGLVTDPVMTGTYDATPAPLPNMD